MSVVDSHTGICWVASIGEIVAGRPCGELALVGVKDSIECVFAYVKRGRVRQEVVANKEGEEDKIINETFKIHRAPRDTLSPRNTELIAAPSSIFTSARTDASSGIDMRRIGCRWRAAEFELDVFAEDREVKELKVRTSGLLENGGPRVDRCITQTIVCAEVYDLSE